MITFAGTIPNKFGTVGVPLSINDLASYFTGQDPVTYSIFSGSLPSGLTLSPTTGIISGTPSAPGTLSVVLRGTDDVLAVANSNTFTIAITPPGTITTPVIKNHLGTTLSNVSNVTVNVYNPTSAALVARKTGLTTDSSGVIVITDGNLVPGVAYVYEVDLTAAGLNRRLPGAVAT